MTSLQCYCLLIVTVDLHYVVHDFLDDHTSTCSTIIIRNPIEWKS